MIPLKKVKEIFKLYGFSVGREKPGVYVAFEAGLSMYSAVEIFVIEENEKELDKVRDYYTSVNFSVVICRASKIEEVELHLFNRFFQVKASNQRIAKRYKEYTESILESYAITDFKRSKPYEYINAPYTKEVNMKLVKTQTSNVVDSIQEDLKDKNPRLIIVEAAAGFGKTSTAMELMNKYANVEKDIRPFMMVLYNDRKVNTFRYLLLSQIESDFNVQLKNNLVIHNIRQGYIPLIIDGFDELLCQDIDKGSTSIDKDRAESMLSVLSGLLTDKAKIVLTTRRTAIFSESSLTEWYERDLKDKATVSVYQLQSPTISDWLPFERVSKLSDEFISIAHPVLLGYLKYLSDAAFDNAAKQSSLMTDYFIRLMEREIVRQSLPFKTIEEQNKILTNLASCFVLFNINSEERSTIKDMILEMSSSILEDYCSDQKSVIKLSNSLTNHAFLDRIKGENIGFINEFVFGTFIGRALLSTDPLVVKNVKDISPRHIEKAIISFAVTDNEQRGKLWEVLESVKTMDSGTRFLSDMYLCKQTKHNMDNQMYDNWQINSCLLGCEDAVVNQCYFNNFTFANCTFDFNYIRGCVFSDCKFYKCTYIGLNHDNEVYHCDIDNANIEPLHDCPIDSIDESTIDEQELMLDILSHYLKVGGRNWRMQMISQLRKEYCQQKLFKSAFAQLVNYGYVITNGDKTFLNDAGFSYYNTNKSKQ